MPVFCPSAPSFLFIISKLWSSFCELRLLYCGQDWLDCQSRCPAHHPVKRWTQDPGLLPEFESKEESCEDSGRESTTHPQGSGRDYAWVSCPLDSWFPVLSEMWFVCFSFSFDLEASPHLSNELHCLSEPVDLCSTQSRIPNISLGSWNLTWRSLPWWRQERLTQGKPLFQLSFGEGQLERAPLRQLGGTVRLSPLPCLDHKRVKRISQLALDLLSLSLLGWLRGHCYRGRFLDSVWQHQTLQRNGSSSTGKNGRPLATLLMAAPSRA